MEASLHVRGGVHFVFSTMRSLLQQLMYRLTAL